jgi:selenium-binding protein 1
MKRREFLTAAAAATLTPGVLCRADGAPPASGSRDDALHHATYATPGDAIGAPRETLAYVVGVYVGTGVNKPDYLATIDLDPESPTYSRIIHRLPMPHAGDELHHFGWNACSSCHGERARRYLVVPGLQSSRIHIIDTADARAPRLHQVIEPREIASKTNLSAPHTVHCLASGEIMISMLGDAKGEAPGGFLMLDDAFQVTGHWSKHVQGMHFNYDFWYQPRHNVMVSSEWGAPNTAFRGFQIEDVQAGKYGRHIHFWDWQRREIVQSVDLGEQGMIPLEVRFHHNPESHHGFVGAALSTALWHWEKRTDGWHVEKVVEVPPVEKEGWLFPVPGLMTDLVVSMDDRWLYFSDWLHGDVRQYDISNPSQPRLAGQVWCGGVLGKGKPVGQRNLPGGPQMLQLSLDGKRLYVTSSLISSWDNQFYPQIAKEGSYMLQIDCDTQRGGMKVNPRFLVDFGEEPHGPARAHEMRFPGGDSTSDIWV